jgi:hypothetical protein
MLKVGLYCSLLVEFYIRIYSPRFHKGRGKKLGIMGHFPIF